MKKLLVLLIGFGLFSCKVVDLNPIGADEKNLVQGSYIIDLDDTKFVPILKDFQKADLIKDPEKQQQVAADRRAEIQNFAAKYGLEVKVEDILVYASSGFYVENVDLKVLKKLLQDKDNVIGVQQDFTIQDIRARMQNVGPFPEDIRARMQEQWGYDNQGFTSKAILYVGGGRNPVITDRKIWIVDSGIDASHQDLNGQLSSGLDKSWVTTSTDESNPKIDFIGHGTHCAGLAAGKALNQSQPNNQDLIGMNGVSPGAQLVSLKIFANDRTAKWNWLRKALEHIGENSNQFDVVSLSLGGAVNSCNSYGIKTALENLADEEVFVVMASGNGENGIGVDVNGFLPGCVDGLNGIYTIGSMRKDFEFPSNPNSFSIFSNFGIQLDWVAPGEMIFSTFPGDRYAVSSGTSVATAIVAGIIHANGAPPSVLETLTGPPGTSTYKIPKRNP